MLQLAVFVIKVFHELRNKRTIVREDTGHPCNRNPIGIPVSE